MVMVFLYANKQMMLTRFTSQNENYGNKDIGKSILNVPMEKSDKPVDSSQVRVKETHETKKKMRRRQLRRKSRYAVRKVKAKLKSKLKRDTSITKTILFWTSYFEHKDYKIGFGRKPFVDYQCEVNRCRTTKDKSLLTTSDAVIIHINDLKPPKKLPTLRYPWQHWVFFTTESPIHSIEHQKLVEYNGLFNTTQTYRLDSDVKQVYGKVENLTKYEKLMVSLPDNLARGKTKLVAWFVSNCKVQSERMAYATELKKTIPLDIYGRCGPLKCEDREVCYTMLNETYKFYLSFENSLCKDYVTEKLWRILQLNVVPVVIGLFDYKKYLPLNSYIDVRDFKSPEDLGKYLIELDHNDTLYNEYFEWKRHYKVIFPHDMASFCDLCKYLHENENKRRSYDELDQWWNKDKDCINAKTYYLGHANLKLNTI